MSEPLSDEAILVRGGLMEVLPMRVAIDTCYARKGFYGLSFWGENDLGLPEVLALAGLPHRHIRVSTVGRVRVLGHEPVRTDQRGHLVIKFAVPPTDTELVDLANAFDPPIPNPLVGKS
jgi:hypothetical protein